VDATSFELNVTVAPDPRLSDALRDLAVHAARYAGCRGADADIFGSVVERVVRTCFDGMPGPREVDVIVRRENGPVEFLISADCARVANGNRDPHIAVTSVSIGGRRMCCVARRMPADS
jgi:hypothetical protein